MNRLVVAGCLSLALALSAHAAIEPRFSVAFGHPDGRVAVNYRFHLVAGALEPGASFTQHVTFYDIVNLDPGVSRQPADWVVSFQSRGIDADDIDVRGSLDSAKYMNITWTWVGTTRIEAPVELGIFGYDQVTGAGTRQPLFASQVSRDALPLAPLAMIGRLNGPRSTASLDGAQEERYAKFALPRRKNLDFDRSLPQWHDSRTRFV